MNFDTGENHANLPQPTDNLCTNCHIPEGEIDFDVSIKGAHTTSRFSNQLPGVVFEILGVRDGAAGKRPVVTFTLKDKNGAPLQPSTLQQPLADYWRADHRLHQLYPRRRPVRQPAPATATRTPSPRPFPPMPRAHGHVSIEGRRSIPIMDRGETRNVNDAGNNVTSYFSRGQFPCDAAPPGGGRRQVQ